MIVLEEKSPALYNQLKEIFSVNETNKILMINGVPLTSHSFSVQCNHGTSFNILDRNTVIKELKDGKPSSSPKVTYTPYTLRYNHMDGSINILNKSFKKKQSSSEDIVSDYLWDGICNYLTSDDIDNYFDTSMYVNDKRPELSSDIEIDYIKEYNIIHLMSPEFKILKDLFNSFNFEGDEDLPMNFTKKGIDIFNTLQVKEILNKADVKAHLMKSYTLIYYSIFLPTLKFDRKSLFMYSQAFCPVWYYVPYVNIKDDVYKYIFDSNIPNRNYVNFIDDKIHFSNMDIESNSFMTIHNSEGVSGVVVFRTHKDICSFLRIKYIPFTPSLLFTALSKAYRQEIKVPIYLNNDNIGEFIGVDRDTGVYYRTKKSKDGDPIRSEIPSTDVRIVNELYFTIMQEYKNIKILSFKAFEKFKETYVKEDMPLDSQFNYAPPALSYNFYYKQLNEL